MKYKRLSSIELDALKDDFIKFLVLQGIDANSWVEIKKDNDKAEKLIEVYSDVVWQSIIDRVQYLEQIDSSGIKLYRCETNLLFLIGIFSVDGTHHDFTNMSVIVVHMRTTPENFQIIKAKKKYHVDRSQEIFSLIINDHAYVTKGVWYELLDKTSQKAESTS